MIAVKCISKTHTNTFKALNNISLTVDQGEFVFLVGPSGAGKSTLLNCLFCKERITNGEINVLNYPVHNLTPDQIPYLRRQIGVIFQDYKLLPKRTVYENIAFALQVLHVTRSQVHQMVHQVLELVNLTSKAHHYPTELSGGEQQRVCIARAIVHNPPILLADEPTGNLDPDTAWDIMQLLTKVNHRKKTVIIATHDRDIVNKMRKRVIKIENGAITHDQAIGQYHAV